VRRDGFGYDDDTTYEIGVWDVDSRDMVGSYTRTHNIAKNTLFRTE